MLRILRVCSALVLGLAAQLPSKTAVAQDGSKNLSPAGNSESVKKQDTGGVPGQPVRFVVRVQLPDARVEVRAESHELIAQCVQVCELQLPPGNYTATERTKDGNDLRELEFTVNGPGSIEIQEPHMAVANVGRVLGILGTLAIPIGATLILTANSGCGAECPNARSVERRAQVGAALLLSGFIVAPIGWTVFGVNHTAHVHYTSASTPDIRVAVMPTRNGANVGLAASF